MKCTYLPIAESVSIFDSPLEQERASLIDLDVIISQLCIAGLDEAHLTNKVAWPACPNYPIT
jgi:hypothetical protein